MMFRKEPPMPRIDNDPDVAHALAHLTQLGRERDDLKHENITLRQEVDELQRRNDFISSQLISAEKKKDLYQRHAIALFTRLRDMIPLMKGYQDMLLNALNEAKIEAMQGGAEPPARHLEQETGGAEPSPGLTAEDLTRLSRNVNEEGGSSGDRR